MGGEKLWDWLRGEDYGDAELEHQKSIGHSHVLPPELRTPEGAYAVANKLLHKSAMRLRKARLWASNMTVTLRFAVPKTAAASKHSSGIHQQPWAQSGSLIECQDNQTLLEGLQRIWKQRPSGPAYQKPFFVGVSLGNLVPDRLHTLSLFSGLEEEQRRTRLTTAMDRMNLQIRDQYIVLREHAACGSGGADAHRIFEHPGALLTSGTVLKTMNSYRGRLAPSPSGLLHLGHARTFWTAYQRALAANGTLVLRNEDLDPERSRQEFAEAMLEDLRWLGIVWQEGPDISGAFAPYSQSERRSFYLAAWRRLLAAGWIYPCRCSRKRLGPGGSSSA